MSAGVFVTPARMAFDRDARVQAAPSSIASCRMCDSSAALADETTPYDGTTRDEPSEVIA